MFNLINKDHQFYYSTYKRPDLIYLVNKKNIKSFKPSECIEWNSDLIYIADGHKPYFLDSRTILISSHCHSFACEFIKDKCNTKLFMPIWSLNELKNCNILNDDPVSEDSIEFLFNKWGGIPRQILDKNHLNTNTKNLSCELEKSINNIDFIKIRTIYEFEQPNSYSMSSKICHYYPEKNYEEYSVKFASRYVCEKLMKRFELFCNNETLRFIEFAKEPELSHIRKILSSYQRMESDDKMNTNKD